MTTTREAPDIRRIVVSLLVAGAAAAALIGVSRIGSSSASQTLITPDQSIGLVSVGMSESQVTGILGHGRVVRRLTLQSLLGKGSAKLQSQISYPGFVMVAYPKAGIMVSYVMSGRYAGRAVGLTTADPRYRTAAGLGVGSPAATAEAAGTCYLKGPVRGDASLLTSDPSATQMCVDDDVFPATGDEAATYYTAVQGRVVQVYLADQPRGLIRPTGH